VIPNLVSHFPLNVIDNFSLLKFHNTRLLFAACAPRLFLLSVHRIHQIKSFRMIKCDKCALRPLVFQFQYFNLIGNICIVFHCCDCLAPLFEEFNHFTLVTVVFYSYDLVVLLLELDFILVFLFNLLINLFLKVSSESLTQFLMLIIVLVRDKIIPSFVLYSILDSEIIERHRLVVPVFIVDLVLVYFNCEKLVEKDHRKECKGNVNVCKNLFHAQIFL
jgi:hypothetical protein